MNVLPRIIAGVVVAVLILAPAAYFLLNQFILTFIHQALGQ